MNIGKWYAALMLALCLFALPWAACAQEDVQIEQIQAYAAPDVNLPDDEALFAGYARKVLYGEAQRRATGGQSAGAKLKGDEKLAYDALVPMIQAIADGQRAKTRIAIGEDATVEGTRYEAEIEAAFSEPRGELDTGAIMDALLSDFPYEMYWFDKTEGMRCQVISNSRRVIQIIFNFTVSEDYMGGNIYATDTTLTGAAAKAADTAREVVRANAGKTDLEKLEAYRDYIYDAVEYDYDAVSGDVPYGDPWQIIHVFDGDPSTDVVCEGYAKAFQYLCDLSAFDAKMTCYSVGGKANYVGYPGADHMWNIVTMPDGKNYLVDLTNGDSGLGLFLVCAQSGSVNTYYDVMTSEGDLVRYVYDRELLWNDDVLKLAICPGAKGGAQLPETGDRGRLALWLALCAASATALWAVRRRAA